MQYAYNPYRKTPFGRKYWWPTGAPPKEYTKREFVCLPVLLPLKEKPLGKIRIKCFTNYITDKETNAKSHALPSLTMAAVPSCGLVFRGDWEGLKETGPCTCPRQAQAPFLWVISSHI